ncbi:histidine--tRNA ligase [Lachnoclostridium phytofermentans]|uniref:Histidine--tRNA ligase n=1 Tax=Lachnoclostridium phytofermentans (strain ATCC 700394 / DSM 18823 / ISDg) TaxID=357809 RepID=A9KM46_LACP7|nr:histidine--tRNA ligase [Lachnoclostridium phytofermentans]ABX41389.1 Histidine--tRNA ligase [Lachnoclostridium phytofermentans ISDg]
MKISTVKGMNEYSPNEVLLRDYLQNVILTTYQSFGFQKISTPIMEDIENLENSEGGENLKLLFKVLKRGDKLEKDLSDGNYENLADLGLRYDLTLPLCRYVANNKFKLPTPFRCIQIDRVYRAERPQKGRLREFVQCDIDIIGTDSCNAEIELITTTAKALGEIGIQDFAVKINNRKLLNTLLLSLGFTKDQLEGVCISFDKMSKIGIGGVKTELMQKGCDEDAITKFMNLLSNMPISLDTMREICGENEDIRSLETIINSCSRISNDQYRMEFDLSLVRGQSYYTGAVFEIVSNDWNGSIAGGGRYDNLIGKFTNEVIPAVGFSIGFERIYQMLLENNYQIPNMKKRLAIVYKKEAIVEVLQEAAKYQQDFDIVLYEEKSNVRKQIGKIKTQCDAYLILNQSEGMVFFSEEV